MTVPLSAFILTYNSEVDIQPCLASIAGWADEIFVVDSYSTDRTVEIARGFTPHIFLHQFDGFAAQRNWAIDNLPFSHEWLLHLDADERLTPEIRDEIASLLPNKTNNIDGFYIKRRFYFLGRWLRHGGNYPMPELRLFRRHLVRVIDAGALEFVAIRGCAATLKSDMVHENKRGLSAWVVKANMVSDGEALELITGAGAARLEAAVGSAHIELATKRWLRQNIYNRMSPFLRPFLLFCFRYIIQMGFLDGIPGFVYCFLMHLWYHLLISAKVKEQELMAFERAVAIHSPDGC